MDYQKLYDMIDNQKDSMLNSLDEIISIPSIKSEPLNNMPYGEPCAKVLNRMLSIAENMGFVTKNFDNYVGTIKFNNKPESLGILCHLDVVPVTEKNWSYPPFKATLKDNKIFGRGAIDDKGPAIAVLYAMKSIKDMGLKLKNNVRFVVGTDEENGSSDLEYYATCESMPPKVFTPDGSYPCINIEKGMIRISFDSKYQGDLIKQLHGGTVINGVPAECYAIVSKELPEDTNITVEKVDNGYKIKYTGLSAHASTPHLGDNAITGLIEYLSKFDNSKAIQGLAKIFPHNDNNGKSLGIFAEDELSGKVTSVLSIISLDFDTINCKLDIRFPLNTTKENIISMVTNRLQEYEYNVKVIMAENPHHVDENSEFIKTLLKIYSEETGKKSYCVAIGGGTYVHNIEGGVAFGAEFPNEDNNMHGDDEFIKLDSLMMNCKMFARAIVDICGVEEEKEIFNLENMVCYEDLLKYIADNTNIEENIVEKFLDADEEYLRKNNEIYDIDTPLDEIKSINTDDETEIASIDIDDEIEYISTNQNIDKNLVDDMMFYYSKFLISKGIIDEKQYYNANKWTSPVLSEYIVNKTNIEKSIVDKIVFNPEYISKFYIYEDEQKSLAESISNETGINKNIVEEILSTLNDYETIEF